MGLRARIVLASALYLMAFPALASTTDGILTLLVGLPLLLISAVVLGLMLRRPRTRRAVWWCTGIVAVPTLYAVYLIPDARFLLERGAHVDRMMAGLFFFMLAVVLALGVKLIRSRPRAPTVD